MTIPLSAGPDVALVEWSELRLRAIFDHCKWDPQCGDHPVLARFPLVLESEAVSELTHLAEQLTHEALAAENEILAKPHLLSRLAIPAAIRRCFDKGTKAAQRRHIRVMRFDFHYTTRGWQISEVNADVPGGYVEASGWNHAIVVQSKRFPLIWDELNTNLATWRELLPKSSCPSGIPKLDCDDLVLKPAFGRVGEDVAIHGVTDAHRYNQILRDALRRRTEWIAQQRFDVIPMPTEGGDGFPCIGVYTGNGRMAGRYGRAAHTALIDHDALDVAVLLRRDNHRRPL